VAEDTARILFLTSGTMPLSAIQVIEKRRDEDPGFHSTLEGLERLIESQTRL